MVELTNKNYKGAYVINVNIETDKYVKVKS